MKSTQHDTSIFNVKSPELYLNMKESDIPKKGHSDRDAFVKQELEKCINGVKINGIFIPGSLYYDLNFHYIELDTEEGRTIARPLLRDNGWIIHNDYHQAQINKKHYCIGGSRQLSKQLADYEELRTISGVIKMGDVQIGDKLLGNDGKETTITGVFPQGIDNIYRVTFADGRSVDAGLEHKWGMHSSHGFYRVVTTESMLKDFRRPHHKSGFNYKYYLPDIKPVDYKAQDLPINPYVLGQLLGNGGLTTGTFTINTSDLETIEYLKTLLPDYNILPDSYNVINNLPINRHLITYIGKIKQPNNRNDLRTNILNLGLNVKSGFKFIPPIYKQSSIEQRLEIIAGLLDSDGWISKDGKGTEIKLKSEKLIDDIIEILRSLGIRCQKGIINAIGIPQNLPNGKVFVGDTDYFRCYIRSNINLFKLSRKANKFKVRTNTVRVPVINIEYLCKTSATCITVDNKDKLFLTKDFVPTHNSDTLTSLTLRELNVFDNTTAMLLVTNSQDKATFSGKMKIAHDRLVDFIKIPLLDKDFNKDFLRFGFKETTNDDELHAKLYIYNTDGGHNPEVGAGKVITFFAYDEIGKGKFKESWDAVIPAFKGAYGFRNSGFFAFTGGSVEKSQDAEKFFLNPKANGLFEINDTGRFMPGEYRADFKEKTSFVDYLSKVEGKTVKLGSELDTLNILYSPLDKAGLILDEEAENYLKSGELESYNKHKIYYPRKVADMFLKENANPFSHLSSEFEKLYEYLNTQDYEKQTYKLEEIGDEVIATPLDQHYDHLSTNYDQPIVIIDKPRDLGNDKIFVSGFDPFNVNKTSTSPSRASFYIMRKITTDYSDPYQETMVAWYNGRKDINDCREKIRLLLKYYGAEVGSITLLHEAADDTLTQWFMDRKIGYWLEDSYALAKQIYSKTHALASKGLRPTTKNQGYYIGKMLEYLEEELPDGRRGLWRIKDKLLVKQFLSFSGNLGDHDTLVGFGHTITHLYKEKNYVARVNKDKVKTEADTKPGFTYNNYGFNLVKKPNKGLSTRKSLI